MVGAAAVFNGVAGGLLLAGLCLQLFVLGSGYRMGDGWHARPRFWLTLAAIPPQVLVWLNAVGVAIGGRQLEIRHRIRGSLTMAVGSVMVAGLHAPMLLWALVETAAGRPRERLGFAAFQAGMPVLGALLSLASWVALRRSTGSAGSAEGPPDA